MKPLLRLILLAILLLLLPIISNAQKSKALKNADKAFQKKNYTQATEFYEEAYNDLDDSNCAKCLNIIPRILFQIAECYRMMDVPKQEILWYNKAIKDGYSDSSIHKYLTEAIFEIQKAPSSQPLITSPTPTVTDSNYYLPKKGVRIILKDSNTFQHK
jgi:hypothetical protein